METDVVVVVVVLQTCVTGISVIYEKLTCSISVCPFCVRPSPGAGCTSEGKTAVQQPGQRHGSIRSAVPLSW